MICTICKKSGWCKMNAYTANWPKHCKTCHGKGYVTQYHTPGPAYMGQERIDDDCPDCIGAGQCPRCGEALPNAFYDQYPQHPCEHCKWCAEEPDYDHHPEPDWLAALNGVNLLEHVYKRYVAHDARTAALRMIRFLQYEPSHGAPPVEDREIAAALADELTRVYVQREIRTLTHTEGIADLDADIARFNERFTYRCWQFDQVMNATIETEQML